jgi:hypothetical protein
MSEFSEETGETPPIRHPSDQRGTVGVAVLVGLGVLALGAPLGLLWTVVSPRFGVVKVDGGFSYADAEPEQVIAADGWFAIVGAVAGVVLAVAVWFLLRRWRGLAVLTAMILGSLAAAVLAWWVGYRIGINAFHRASATAAIGTRLDGPLGLRVAQVNPNDWVRSRPTGVVAVQALVAAFVYLCLAGFSSHPQLRGPEPEADPPTAGPDPNGR